MQCKAAFLEKTIFKKCYVTDGGINLISLAWIDELVVVGVRTYSNEAEHEELFWTRFY
ncbi:unnamed protein product [Hymenolepis diminuta]|uniref:Uncharacterized protein n=1 Tax=Hymenolepis diminuta TaxID=6216 RepID=A0A564Y1F1_HYMDI|nr:unnamed protein product [Hymenolepis diminuta]